jgi:pimeloyl-ACP methyl ester carboxylesterase
MQDGRARGHPFLAGNERAAGGRPQRLASTHGALNYYRAAEPYFSLSSAFKGAEVARPSFFMGGKADGLGELYPLTIDQMRAGLPGLVGGIELEGVGHWVHHEASAEVNAQLVKFLSAVHPI